MTVQTCLKKSIEWVSSVPNVIFFQLSILSLSILFFKCLFDRSATRDDDELPIANRSFALEPRVFALLRWAMKARTILDSAYEKVNGTWSCVSRLLNDISSRVAYIGLLEEILIWSWFQ